MNQTQEPNTSLVISYMTLRKAIGFLGLSLPFLLPIGTGALIYGNLELSISTYYYTNMGDVFVGTLCVIGFFLFSYRGHDRRDDIAGDLACVFAIGIAFVPTAPKSECCSLENLSYCLHGIFAGLFFLTLVY